jgi:hypothetical protein
VGMFLSPFIGKRATQNGPSTSEILGASSTWVRNFENIKTWKLHYERAYEQKNTSRNCKEGILNDNNLRSNEVIEFKSNENFKNHDVG